MTSTGSRTLLAALLGLALADAARAQSPEASPSDESTPVASLRGRHSLSLSVGLLARADVAPGVAHVQGMVGGVSYLHWPRATVALELSGDVHDAEARAGVSASIVSLLFGASWYPELSPAASVRPYVGAAVGPYIGSEANGFAASASTRSVVGARLGGGVDVFPARALRVGVRGAYHLVPEFDRAVGSLESASGPQLSVEVGWVFGRAR
jgi:hypothetical protein